LVKDTKLLKIIEALDANEDEKKITLCNGGIMIIKADRLKENLNLLNNNNAKKEFILSDLIEINNNTGGVSSFVECDHEETIGIDSKKGLSKAEKIYQNKLRNNFMEAGTTILDPETVFFSHDTEIGKDVEIGSNIVFGENVLIKDNVVIKSFCSIENSIINDGASIGPFARLRNNVDIGKDSKIGNFVELKNSRLEQEVKVSHLSYIGDAEIDESVNIGAGTITCNYDGVNKHKTIIGKRAFIGSNSSLIAPINIGDDANVAAGSSISKNVDSNSLAITRAPIRFISNWSKKFKKTNKEEE
jgi:bifunctional UDP-N-acetylglucosamine pyrophosphorylase/glucosamine-1-phosphate N-acetyltransferase